MKNGFEYYNAGLIYSCINENIECVLDGISPKKNDIIISIGGSGNIPFAIAPYAKHVYAVDKNPIQIDFIKEQIKLFSVGNKNFYRENFITDSSINFFYVSSNNIINRKRYFEKNLEKVVNKLGNIPIINGNIFEFAESFSFGEYNELYLSNTLDYEDIISNKKIKFSTKHLKIGGLVYECSNFFPKFENFELYKGIIEKAKSKIKGTIRLENNLQIFRKIA